MKKYSYTENDITLISNFFFVDPKIMNPKILTSMLKEIGSLNYLRGNIDTGLNSVLALLSPTTLPILILSALILLIKPNLKTFSSLMLLIVIAYLLGLLGRTGVLRVYVPLLILIFTASLAYLYSLKPKLDVSDIVPKTKSMFLLAACLIAFIFNIIYIYPQAHESKENILKAQTGIVNLPNELIVSWGVGLPIESIYPLFANNTAARSLRIYPFGVFTHAPFSISFEEELQDTGFIKRLISDKGVLIVAAPHNINQLKIWCDERFNRSLREVIIHALPLITIHRVWCGSQ